MEQFIAQNSWVVWLMILWTLPWKGVALWKSARNKHTIWFIVLLVCNTMAILEILYIFVFSKFLIRRKGEEKK
jgi:methionyl-tRNA synthetase